MSSSFSSYAGVGNSAAPLVNPNALPLGDPASSLTKYALQLVSSGALDAGIRGAFQSIGLLGPDYLGFQTLPTLPGFQPTPTLPGFQPMPTLPGFQPMPTLPGFQPMPTLPGFQPPSNLPVSNFGADPWSLPQNPLRQIPGTFDGFGHAADVFVNNGGATFGGLRSGNNTSDTGYNTGVADGHVSTRLKTAMENAGYLPTSASDQPMFDLAPKTKGTEFGENEWGVSKKPKKEGTEGTEGIEGKDGKTSDNGLGDGDGKNGMRDRFAYEEKRKGLDSGIGYGSYAPEMRGAHGKNAHTGHEQLKMWDGAGDGGGVSHTNAGAWSQTRDMKKSGLTNDALGASAGGGAGARAELLNVWDTGAGEISLQTSGLAGAEGLMGGKMAFGPGANYVAAGIEGRVGLFGEVGGTYRYPATVTIGGVPLDVSPSVGAAGRTFVGGEAGAKGFFGYVMVPDPVTGQLTPKAGVELKAAAFAGAKAEGDVEVGVGGNTVGMTAGALAGIGAEGKFGLGLDTDSKGRKILKLEGKLAAALGIGASLGFKVEINITAITNFTKNFIHANREAFEAVKTAFSNAFQGTKQAFSDGFREVKQFGTNVLNTFKDVGHKIEDGVKDVANKIEDGVKDVGNKIADGAKDVVDKVGDGIKKAGKKVKNFFKKLF